MLLDVYIFSFNRGPYLKNCLRSVQGNILPDSDAETGADESVANGRDVNLTVIDDNSTEPATLELLNSISSDIKVLQPEAKRKGRHGGLYANMQLALDHAREGSVILFLQDDMQIVRPLDNTDFQYIERYFAYYSQSAFLNPVFLKGQRKRRDKKITRLQVDFPVYYRIFPRKKNSRGISYADVVLAHRDRLKRAKWEFLPSEVANAQQAMNKFGRMGFMASPFVMFLPEVPVYRGNNKTFAVRVSEKRKGLEPRAYEPMTSEQVQALRERDLKQLPVAEHYLTTSNPNVKKPFEYSQVNVSPTLRVLHKIELAYRTLIGK